MCNALWSRSYRLAEKASRWGMTNLHRPTLLNIGIFTSSCWIQLEYNQKAKKYFYFISILQYMKQQHFSSKSNLLATVTVRIGRTQGYQDYLESEKVGQEEKT